MNLRATYRGSGHEGFSLIELLTVLAIISILTTLSYLALQGLLGSNTLSSAGQHVQEIVSQARQNAITRSRTVEIRFYRQQGGSDFNGYQLVLYKPDLTVDQFLTKPQFLPAGVVISGTTPNPTAPTTSLLGVNLPFQTDPTDGSTTSGLTYASVRFSPSGGLKDVTPSSTYYYYLLIVPQRGSVTNLGAPDRIILSVDPTSGIVQYNRP